jgi:hypothetical protein
MATFESKFQVKPSMIGGVFNAPNGIDLPFPVQKKLKSADFDFIIVFVANAADIKAFGEKACSMLVEDGILWFCYPKKSGRIKTDIHRDVGWEPLAALGYRGVRAISIDETWSALRFRSRQFVNS